MLILAGLLPGGSGVWIHRDLVHTRVRRYDSVMKALELQDFSAASAMLLMVHWVHIGQFGLMNLLTDV